MYQTVQGDTWDMIAKKVYQDEAKLDFLMANNPDLLDYFIFPAGVILQTPKLPENEENNLPEWRR